MVSSLRDHDATSFPRRGALIACALVLVVCGCALVGWSSSLSRAHDPRSVNEFDFANAASVLVLVSIDGFRADYFDRFAAPNIAALARRGVRARQMRPVFPSKTFPNHWSIITGLYPESHGIVGNTFWAPDLNKTFTIATGSADPSLWGGVPLWSAAEQQNVRTGTVFWPGSEIGGNLTHPTIVLHFNSSVSNNERAAHAVRLVREGMRFVTLYMDVVDSAGHQFGVDGDNASMHLQLAITQVDTAVGMLVASLERLAIAADYLIVADHGMVSVAPDVRSVDVDLLLENITEPYRLVDPKNAGDSGPLLSLFLEDETKARQVAAQLVAEHAQFWAREDIPEAYQFRNNVRIPHVLGLAEIGWVFKKRGTQKWPTLGTHGYNNTAPEMQALCIGAGPSFRVNQTIDTVRNLDLVNVMAAILDIKPPPNNGTDEARRLMLRQSILAKPKL